VPSVDSQRNSQFVVINLCPDLLVSWIDWNYFEPYNVVHVVKKILLAFFLSACSVSAFPASTLSPPPLEMEGLPTRQVPDCISNERSGRRLVSMDRQQRQFHAEVKCVTAIYIIPVSPRAFRLPCGKRRVLAWCRIRCFGLWRGPSVFTSHHGRTRTVW